MPKIVETHTTANGKTIARFICGHFILYPKNREDYIIYRRCSACEVSRTFEENKQNILNADPTLEEYLNRDNRDIY